MRRRHDPFLKRFYRLAARDTIRLFFPEVAARIDWEALRWEDKEVIIRGEPDRDAPDRSVIADLVGVTRDVEGRYVRVFVHPEITLERRANMGWRVLQYNAGLLLQEANPDARVLTFVLYHCPGGGGVQEEEFRLEFYDRTVHQVGYWSVTLGALDAEAYAESENPAAWALAAWMRQRREGRAALRLRLMAKILRFVQDAAYRRVLLDALRSYFRLDRTEQQEERRLLEAREYSEVSEMFQTELDRLEAKARREGRAQARQELQTERERLEELRTELERLEAKARRQGEELGQQTGRVEGEREALRRIVQARFPTASETVYTRISAVQDLALLDELIRSAAVAGSIDEIERLLAEANGR